MPKNEKGICIVSGFDYLIIPSNGQMHSPDPDELLSSPSMSVFAVAVCSECKSHYLLVDDDVQEVEVDERQMGNEVYYAADCWGRCESCKLDLNVKVDFSTYAGEWVLIDHDSDNCEMAELPQGLETLIEEVRKIRVPAEVEEIEDWAESPEGCAVFVEGKDDQLVIMEFLRRIAKAEPTSLGINVLRGIDGGGKEWVVRSAAFVDNVMKRVGKEIRYLVVLDGDALSYAKTVQGPVSKRLFLLPKKELESYLLDAKAIAQALASEEAKVQKLLNVKKGGGKETLEFALQSLGVHPSPQVKQIIARHVVSVPRDFERLMEAIRTI